MVLQYACRKTLADKRVRVRGRFAKNNEPCEEELAMNTSHDTNSYEQNNSFYEDSFQVISGSVALFFCAMYLPLL